MFDWLLPFFVAFSMSANTPNVSPNPYDYNVQLQLEKADTLYVGRYWERQLGVEYIGQEYWIAQTWYEYIYTKNRYINVPSNDLHFYQGDVRLKIGIFSFGYAYKYDYNLLFRNNRHRTVFGIDYSTTIDKVGFNFSGETTYDNKYENPILDYFVKTSFDFKLNGTIKLFVSGDIVEDNNVQNWSTKIGLQVHLKDK